MADRLAKGFAAFAGFGVIAAGTLTQDGGQALPAAIPDWAAHFAGFAGVVGVLSLMTGRGCANCARVLVLALIVAAATEIGQSAIGGRHPELTDFLANAAGTFAGVTLAALLKAAAHAPAPSRELAAPSPADLWRQRPAGS